MSPAELLERFTAEGVELWAEGDRLRYRARGNSLAPAAIEDLRSHKQALLDILRHTPEADFPATSGQQALWLKQQMLPSTAAYNVALALRITSPVDAAALARALSALVARHAALRSVFTRRGEQLRQIVQRRQDVPLEQVDAAGRSEAQLQAGVRAAYRRPFSLETGPLFRATLFTQPQQAVLLLNVHHIVCDAWSIGVLLEELRALYAGEPLGAPPAPFSQFAALPSVEQNLAFWQQELAGAPAATGLATDEPRPARASGEGATLPFAIPGPLLAELKQVARRQDVTLYTLLLAVWQVLLSRYSGEADITVGAPSRGRDEARFHGTTGYFVNMVALRGDLSGNPDFLTLLARTKTRVLAAMAHPYPFADLLDRLQIARDPSRTPLFQVTFNLQQLQGSKAMTAALLPGEPPADWGGLQVSHFPLDQQEGQFDLSLELIEAPGRMVGVCKYSTDLFHAPTIARMAGHYLRLLEGIAADPARPIADLPLLPAGETAQIEAWNQTATPYDLDRCLHHLFEEQVRRTPDAVALVFEGRSLTYAQFNARANQLARELRARGVKAESRVALFAERSLDLMIGLYAIVKAGAAWVPIDPEYPPDRIAYMIEDCAASLLLTQAHLNERLAGVDAPVLCIGQDSHHADTNLNLPQDPDSLAYVIYTSGSTGRPKGAMNQHRGIVNRLLWMQDAYRLDATDAVLQKTPISFDVSVWELFWPLLTGARLVLAKPGGHREPAYLIDTIRQHQITTLHFVPSMLEIFVAEPGVTHGTSIRRVIASGEELSYELQQRFFAKLSCELHNLYGPTEAAVDVSYWPCDRDSKTHRVPIGKPIANLRLEVLDSNLQRTPIGVPGELYLAGAGVGRGYHARPALTAERFVPDPYTDGGRLYRTGDQARWLANGNVEYLGRLDSQVKLRGFRIELGEIEAALASQPGVREAVVILRNHPQRLVAYLTGDASPDTLRAALAAKLPAYMVPAAFVTLDRLPLNANGKVDRKALPAPAVSDSDHSQPASPSWTEDLITGIWRDVLKIRHAGRDDSFFELGGHSLLVMQVLARLRQSFQVELSVAQFFATPTIAGLAAAIQPNSVQLPPLTPRPRPERPPLSFAQQRMYFLQQLEPQSPFYNVPLAWDVQGAFDAEAFRTAVDALMARHAALRTAFADDNGAVWQSIAETLPAPLTLTDLTAHPDPFVEARRLANEDLATVFTLDRAPLFRIRVLRLAPDRHAIIVILHHIISDGWTLGLLSEELGALYRGGGSLAALPIDAIDFALWQREWMASPAKDEQLAWWRRQLEGIPAVLEMPTDRPRPAVQRYRGATVYFTFPPALAERLKAFSTAHNATLFMTLLAGFAALLAKYSGQQDLVIGTPVAGRNRAELEPIAGVFLNSLAMRVRPEPGLPFLALVAQVRQTALDAWARQDLPFESLVDEMQPERSRGITPIFQAMLVLLNTPPETLDLGPGARVQPFPLDGTTSKLDLNLTLRESRQGIDAAFEYDSDLFDPETIERLAGHYLRLLESAVAEPSRALASLALLNDGETAQLEAWNQTATPYDLDRCLHHLFEDQVRRTPDAVALVFEGRSLTYAQLNARANQLARELRARGVTAESRVALFAERSLELMIGLYAIVKAGAAWVPIDPEYPPDRIAYMIEDCAASLLLTQAHLSERLAGVGAPVLCIGQDWNHADTNLNLPQDADSLAYVIYTSGSTGQPKGAMNQHRGIVNRLLWMQDAYRLNASDAVLQKTPISFDVSVWELFWPLFTGARLILAKPGGHREPAYLIDTIRQHQITTLHFVPSMLEIFVAEPNAAQCTSIRRVIASGEELSYELQQRFFLKLSCELHNLYGPTEAAVDVSYWPCDPNTQARRVPIGKPIANLRLEVLDSNLQRTPIGVPGELYLAGVGVGRGYHARPALTAERFVPDPYTDGGRLYRTGDQARWLANGNVEYLGRLDSQVKLRGFRIELGEIEAALASQPGVREAAVILRNDPQRLVAYLTGDASHDTLRSALAAKLPVYMIPAAFVTLDRLPLTPNGKLDRRALPAVPEKRDLQAFLAPRTPAEQALAAIWAELLNLPQVGIHDNFFFLGGDSIVSMLVVARARRKGYALTVADLFSHQTIAELAAVATPIAGSAASTTPAAPLTARPLTAIERWFFSHASADPHHYNQATLLETPAGLDPTRLAAALDTLLARHDAWRSRYTHSHEHGWQWAPSSLTAFPFEVIDAPDLTAALAAHAPRLQASLTLEDGTLLRATLFVTGQDTPGRLLLVFHHLLIDGVSWRILLEELHAAYHGEALPDAPASFHEWAAAQPDAPLALPAARVLPVDDVHGENLAGSAEQVTCTLSEEHTRALTGGIQNALLDALATALTAWTRTPSIRVDVEGHGRDSLVASTIGWFTTIRTLELAPHRAPATPTGNAAAEVLFNYLGRFEHNYGWQPAPEPIGPLVSPRAARSHLIEVTAYLLDGRLHYTFTYSRHRHQRTTITALAADFQAALGAPQTTPASSDSFPLSPMQAGMLFETLLAPGKGVYWQQWAFELTGHFDAALFREAWDTLLARHDALRSQFRWEGVARPVQSFRPDAALTWDMRDYSALTPDAQRAALDTYLHEDRTRPLDLSAAPLMRMALLHIDATRTWFVWSHHHLLLDGWSMGIVLQELLQIYQARLDRRPPRLAPPASYRDYIAWIERQDPAAAERYWRDILAGFRPSTALTNGKPQAPEAAYRIEDLRLPTDLTAALQQQARRHHVTASMLLQAAWALVLSRAAGTLDVAFGIVAATRPADVPGIDHMAGVLINTVPLRLAVKPQVRTAAWAAELREAQIDRDRYSHCSLAEIQAWSGLPREEALFESVLVFENFPIDESLREQSGALRFSVLRIDERPHYPLLLVVSPGSELLVRFSYDESRIDAPTARSLAATLRGILTAMAADLEQPASQLAPPVEPLATVGNPLSPHPLHHAFEAQAARTPTNLAVIDETASLTYSELNTRAEALAAALGARGVTADTIAGVCLERSVDMVVALLGVLKAGAAYLPLDPGYPPDRLQYMREDSGAAVLITANGIEGPPAPPAAHREPAPENLAYVIYTSGSTGRPKGVLQTHRAIANHMAWMQHTFPLTAADRVLQKTPFSFDASVWEFYAPLFTGGALVMARPGAHQDPPLLVQAIRDHQVTILQLVPSQLNLLLAEPGFAECTSLRRVFCGGEALTPDLQRRLHAALPEVELVNLYGPTETCIDSTYWVCQPGQAQVPIGHPVWHTQAWVLNERLEPAPPGIRGELYLGGAGLARGYLRRPALTAERFVPNPFDAGTRLYRTGDLVRQLADGSLEYLGRADSQVKLRGFRVELEEIESAMAACPGIARAAVIAADDRLLGFFVPQSGANPDLAALRAHLQRLLPEHMVPAMLLELDAFPLSPSGKIDRRALAAIDISAPAQGKALTPEDPFHALLIDAFARVLNLDPAVITPHSNFFELGGHSLLATQLVSRIRGLFKVELRLRQFFDAATPALLATLIRTRKSRRALAPPLTARTEPFDDAPLSFAQQRLWFLHQMEGTRGAYNIPAAIRLRGPLNLHALEAAFTAIAERHESLRTTFHVRQGEVRQVIAPPAPLRIPVIDGDEQTIDQLWAQETTRVFDLEAGPLLHATVLRLDALHHVLFANWHHIASDGWSIALFLREVAALYEAHCGGRPAQLAPLPVQYADFARWQRQWLSGDVLNEYLAHWTQRLQGAPPLLQLPLDHLRPALETHAGARHRLTLPPALVDQLKALARQSDATLFMALLAGFAALLARHSGQTDLVIGSPVANRNQAEIEGLLGVFVNNLALRIDLSGSPAFTDLLRRVRETALDAYTYQDLPFERLVEALQPQRNLSHSPLFQVLFSMQTRAEEDALRAYGLTLQPLDRETPVAKYDLSLYVTETPAGLHAEFEYNTNLFEPATIHRLAGQYEHLLAGAAADPATPVDRLNALSPVQRQELLAHGEGPSLAMPDDLHLISPSAAPHQIAVTSGGVSLTYAELQARVDRLAHGLAAHGVGPEVRVGISMDRGIDMLVAALAISKAGGAYVPLDPAFPTDRLQYMREDAGLSLVLTADNIGTIAQAHAPLQPAHPDHLAYILYTSGSTGRPKGVQVTRRNLANFLASLSRHPGLRPGDTLVAVTTLSFDIAALELYLPLGNGAHVVIATREEAADGLRLLDLLQRSNATVMQATPATWRVLLDSGWRGDPVLRVFCGGEAFPLDLAARLQALGLEIWNLYGPTETTIWSSLSALHQDPPPEGAVSIGRPIGNTTLYVLDSDLRLLPPGVPGDLYIGGEGVARGYRNRPSLTAAAFLPDPFSNTPGARLYRTGDIARVLHDGRFECLGRTDHQTKLHGFRIELGEIEAVLGEHPHVAQAVAAVRGERLVAYLVTKGEAPVSELRQLLESRLPRYMVPATFVTLDAFPLTANGKVDRRALPDPTPAAPALHAPPALPTNAIEEALAAIWRDVLDRDTVGIHDNFFDLGGHSLLLVQVQLRVRDRLDLEVGVMELFEHPNIAALARHLDQRGNGTLQTLATSQAESRAQQRRNALQRRKAGS